MLEFLKIENLALLEKATIDFREGFTVVTGETGAGKSVFLGALAMLAGNRCGKEVIKNGADFCSVEASFCFKNSEKIAEFLESEGLPELDNSTLILRRIIFSQKSAKCFINGALVPLGVLQRFGEYWIDFHTAKEPQKLFSQKNQLEVLDNYAKLDAQKSEYLNLLNSRKQSLKRLDELKFAKQMDGDEIEFVKSQIEKIERFSPTREGIAELETSYKMLENSLEISEKCAGAASAIDGESRASDSLSAAKRLLDEIANSSDSAAELSERLNSVIIELADISSDLENLSQNCVFSEEQAAEIRARMEAWMSLRRKYGNSAEEVLAALEKMREKLAGQGDVKKNIDAELEKINAIESKMKPLAERIFESRKKSSLELAKKTICMLKKLGFKKPNFDIEINRLCEFSSDCGSACEFLFSANAGQPVSPLAKVASSGEMARVMLAIKTTLAQADKTPLLVFDEVDANVGGEIGVAVASELANLAKTHQVFCVTHLPQVAAHGDTHLFVNKTMRGDSTSVEISELASEARVFELARMLGDRTSSSAIAHARELLSKSL